MITATICYHDLDLVQKKECGNVICTYLYESKCIENSTTQIGGHTFNEEKKFVKI